MKKKLHNVSTPELASLEQYLPKSLDDIIRDRRNVCSLGLSNTEDFASLPPMVSMLDNIKQIRATINDWRIVCLTLPSGKNHILTGINETSNNAWATSALKSVDFQNNLVLTENSIYRLGIKGEGEPDLAIRLHICYCLHSWGLGAPLGVPRIFY